MLMDNMGAGGGNFSEKGPVFSAPESNPMLPPTGEVDNFNEYLNERADLKPDFERPAEMAESQEAADDVERYADRSASQVYP